MCKLVRDAFPPRDLRFYRASLQLKFGEGPIDPWNRDDWATAIVGRRRVCTNMVELGDDVPKDALAEEGHTLLVQRVYARGDFSHCPPSFGLLVIGQLKLVFRVLGLIDVVRYHSQAGPTAPRRHVVIVRGGWQCHSGQSRIWGEPKQ